MTSLTSNKELQTEKPVDTLVVKIWKYIFTFVYNFGDYVENNLVVLYNRKSNPYKGADDFLAIILMFSFHYNMIINYILDIWLMQKQKQMLIFKQIIRNNYNRILQSIIHHKSAIYCFFSTLTLIRVAADL
jgi:hypothetical protein